MRNDAADTGSDPSLRRVTAALHQLSRTMRRLGETRLGLDPLPPTEFEVLRVVVEDPGTSVTHVAHQLAMQPSNVSTAVRNLVARGLVLRTPDQHDRRIARLAPTQTALEHRLRIEETRAAALAAALTQLPAADTEALRGAEGALTRLAPALARLAGTPPTAP